jgi:hypothetical protein
MKKFTLSEFGNWLFKRQVKDDTLSQAISRCSFDGSPTNLELRKASHLVGHISRSSRRCNQYMNPFDSSIFLSVTRKSSNALVTFSDRICFECDEKGHYVNKCPQRRPKDQPTKTGIATLQSIQCSSSYKSQIIGNQNVLRSQATQNVTQTPPDRKYYNCEEKGHYFNGCPNPCIHHPFVLITNIAPTSSKRLPWFASIVDRDVTLPSNVLIDANDRPHRTRNATIVKKRNTLLLLPPIHVHVLPFHHQQRQHPITKEVLH